MWPPALLSHGAFLAACLLCFLCVVNCLTLFRQIKMFCSVLTSHKFASTTRIANSIQEDQLSRQTLRRTCQSTKNLFRRSMVDGTIVCKFLFPSGFVPFSSYCEIFVKSRRFLLTHLHLPPPFGVTPFEFRQDLWRQNLHRVHEKTVPLYTLP